MDPIATVLDFLERINAHDADALAERMTEDHRFVDSLGNAVQGRDAMRAGWQAYYALCPDYWVSHETIFAHGHQVAAFGSAGGTIAVNGTLSPDNRWRIPAAWLAIVADDRVQEWRVYADTTPVRDIVAKGRGINDGS
jgi:ketosteroid isomerase-like protein